MCKMSDKMSGAACSIDLMSSHNCLCIAEFKNNHNNEFIGMNWFGNVVEPVSDEFGSRYGSLHNAGHGVFGRMVSSRDRSRGLRSYMTTTVNAVRDPIFYRYHFVYS